MEPSTLLPPNGLIEGYGLSDEALNQLISRTGYREVTLQFRSAIEAVQTAFRSDTRIRIISLPLEDEQEPLWSNMVWSPLWSNRDTCILITDPFKALCRHDQDYLIPLGFAQHFTHTNEGVPYYLPQTAPEVLWPRYLDKQQIRISISHCLSHEIPLNPDPFATIFSIILETLFRIRNYLGDYCLIEHGFSAGVAYHYSSYIYELSSPQYLETIDTPWSLPFLLLDLAQAVNTLRMTKTLTLTGIQLLSETTNTKLMELTGFLGISSHPYTKRFGKLLQCFTGLQPTRLHDPLEANELLNDLLYQAGLIMKID